MIGPRRIRKQLRVPNKLFCSTKGGWRHRSIGYCKIVTSAQNLDNGIVCKWPDELLC